MTSLSNPKHRDQPLHCVAETTAPRASFEKDWPTCNYLQQMGGKSENFTIWLNILILRWNKLSLPFANKLQVISKRGNSWSGFVPDRFHHEKRWWRRLPRTDPWFSSTSRLSVGHHHQWRARSAVVSSPQQIFWHISPSLPWHHCCSPKCNAMYVRKISEK